ncbi:MFS transporter [Pseudoalteromonas sp. C2R02]|uniref:MFS transporter n=1 Tax=Pseudoalteromonas sp. C2R02 TaxID=2841565 RepID=UPI001C082397|nr:MFS transporter [Pseudoalteromonas sp. C2R02]
MSDEQTIKRDSNNSRDISKNNSIFSFSSNYYVANTMEIFERLAWYGIFGVLSLYMTAPLELGGLGATDQQRGTLSAVVMSFIYLLPVLTGALGDRYGYRKMLLISFALMTPSYYMLGQVDSYGAFFITYMVLAVGAAIFKPLIVGTVSRETTDANRSLGFGLFYTMVNIGGFLGPLTVAYLREISWELAFTMAAVSIAINFIPAIFFFRDPTKSVESSKNNKSIKETLVEVQNVLGNGRLALMIVPIMVMLLIPGTGLLSWKLISILCASWVVINFIWDKVAQDDNRAWYGEKIKFGNVPFILYLLILAGFWAVYLQIFVSLNIFIRDYINTGDLITFFNSLNPNVSNFMSGANSEKLISFLQQLNLTHGGNISPEVIQQAYFKLTNYSVMVPFDEISKLLSLDKGMLDMSKTAVIANEWINKYQQVKPELIASINFGSIVILQLFFSKMSSKFKIFHVLVGGTLLLSLSYLMLAIAPSLLIAGTAVVAAVLLFSIGEMLVSPKSMEYIAMVMPKEKSAMYQGYLYLASAFGFLAGGLLSGVGYEYFAKTLNKPELFWYMFAAIGVLSALALFAYDKFFAHKLESQKQD